MVKRASRHILEEKSWTCTSGSWRKKSLANIWIRINKLSEINKTKRKHNDCVTVSSIWVTYKRNTYGSTSLLPKGCDKQKQPRERCQWWEWLAYGSASTGRQIDRKQMGNLPPHTGDDLKGRSMYFCKIGNGLRNVDLEWLHSFFRKTSAKGLSVKVPHNSFKTKCHLLCTTKLQNSPLQIPWKQILPRSSKATGQTADQQEEEIKADWGIAPSRRHGNRAESKTQRSHFSLEETTRNSNLEFWSHWWGSSRSHTKF